MNESAVTAVVPVVGGIVEVLSVAAMVPARLWWFSLELEVCEGLHVRRCEMDCASNDN